MFGFEHVKMIARFARFVTALIAGVIVTSCSGATTRPSSSSSTVGSTALSTNVEWTLQSLVETGSPVVAIADPSVFTLVLTDGGKLQARADCNRASASYTIAGQTLSVGLMASTKAYCASAPVDGLYLTLLSGENIATVGGATLQLSSPRGTLRFVR